MPDWVHRTTKQYLQSVSEASLPEAAANYIEDPDLSAVIGVDNKYWKIVGDTISEMNQTEKDAVDDAILEDSRDTAVEMEIDNLESIIRQVVILMVDEINILRAQHSLADRTLAQVKTQIRNALGS